MTTHQHIRTLITALLFMAGLAAWGQTINAFKETDGYYHTGNSYTLNRRITGSAGQQSSHWYEWRKSYTPSANYTADTFDESTSEYHSNSSDPNSQLIQAAHTYVDTLYVKKGSSTEIYLPIINKIGFAYLSAHSYIRWYDFQTEKSFAFSVTNTSQGSTTTTNYDLLAPIYYTKKVLYKDANLGYFGGYVFGDTVDTDKGRVKFYYPTDDEYTSCGITGMGNGNKYYVLACDISPYQDGALSGSTITEPTLSMRVIYYIAGIDDDDLTDDYVADMPFWKYIKQSREAGSNTADFAHRQYYETYDISFPATRFDKSASYDMVSLSKDATAFCVPGSLERKVTITIDANNSSGIKLIDQDGKEVTKNSYDITDWKEDLSTRCIRFSYPITNSDSTQSVYGNNTTATIYVTSPQGDGLARYNLTFTNDTRLLSLSEIRAIEKDSTSSTLSGTISDFKERTPQYMDNNYQLVASIDFDYDPKAEDLNVVKDWRDTVGPNTKNGNGLYPFPMDWAFSSFGFIDGSKVHGNSYFGVLPQFSHYGITKWYMLDSKWFKGFTNGPIATELPNGKSMNDADHGYFLYVDASYTPSRIAQLGFKEDLCAGAKLYFTAWIKNATDKNKNNRDASLLMSVLAVREDSEGNEIESKVIARHSTGMFPHTAMCTRYGGLAQRDTIPYNAKEEWLQTYFSVVTNKQEFENLDIANGESIKYYLRLENNSEGTIGADYYVDDIKVYVSLPHVEAAQVQPICSTMDARMQVKLDYDRVLSRVGDTDVAEDAQHDVHSIACAVVDSAYYAEAYQKLVEEKGIDNITSADLANLLKTYCVDFAFLTRSADGSVVAPEESAYSKLQVLHFCNSFGYLLQNAAYDVSSMGHNAPATIDGQPYWLCIDRTSATGSRYLSIDVSVGTNTDAIVPGRTYTLVMDIGGTLDSYDFDMHDVCGYRGSFVVSGSLVIQTAGEVITPETQFCAGQVNSFTAKLVAYDSGLPLDLPQAYFDWFFGTEEEYDAEQAAYGNATIRDALTKLRDLYPRATNLDKVHPNATEGFTQQMFDLIQHLLDTPSPEYLNTKLVLRKQTLNIRLLEGGLNLMVAPIPLTTEIDGKDYQVCFDPMAVTFSVSSNAPEALVGFNGEKYALDAQAALRIGLNQMTKIYASADNTITLPLRDVKYAEGHTGVDAVGLITSNTVGTEQIGYNLDHLFLLYTDDPDFNNLTDGQYAYVVGNITELTATEGNEGHVTFYFDPSSFSYGGKTGHFVPREGFTYYVKIWFQEMSGGQPANSDQEGAATCYGSIVLPIKVVPEYLRYVGNSVDNWNNDEYWKRSTSAELYKTSGYEDYTMPEGYELRQNQGFVPMNFSKVTMPEASQIELYQAIPKGKLLNLEPETKPTTIGSPTYGIESDLMAEDAAVQGYNVIPYYTNTAKHIHFEPRAEMLRTEWLTYDSAWVDLKLPTAEWSLAASPFRYTYSGELYAPNTNGWQQTEYFQPITFNTTHYDRFAPAIYQRTWERAEAVRLEDSDGTTCDLYFNAEWSGVYNKVDELYDLGRGFSIKPVKGNLNVALNDSVLIRLPKNDTAYLYYSDDPNTGSQERTSILTQSKVYPYGQTDYENGITASLVGKEGYYLVGNPFMAHLNLTQFFAQNPSLDNTKYWTLDEANTLPITSSEYATDDEPLIAPLQAFFVKLKADATEPATVTFTPAMESLGDTNAMFGAQGRQLSDALTLTATLGTHISQARVCVNEDADSGYANDEDVEAILLTANGTRPLVYTVAGTVAAAINCTPQPRRIAIGAWGEEGKLLPVSITGTQTIDGQLSLLDTQTNTVTPVSEGDVVSLVAGAHGRYYLQIGTAESAVDDAISIFSPGGGQIVVSSPASDLTSVRIFTPDGRQAAATPLTTDARRHTYHLAAGTYIVQAANDAPQSTSAKVVVGR